MFKLVHLFIECRLQYNINVLDLADGTWHTSANILNEIIRVNLKTEYIFVVCK
jgi:hypothetical protein